MKNIKIINAKYLEDYKIQIEFDDKKIQIVDFSTFLKESKHPEIKKYLNLKMFKEFSVVDGDLDWHNLGLTFPIFDLYYNKIINR